MLTTTTNPDTVEAEVREFAVQYPTPSVLAALGHCESGRLSWAKVHALFTRSLAAGVMAVAEPAPRWSEPERSEERTWLAMG